MSAYENRSGNKSNWIGYLSCKTTTSYFIALAFCLCIALPTNISAAAKNSPGNVFITGTEKRFDTLSEALHSAKDGDTLKLTGSTYKGNFVIDRNITIIGIGDNDVMPVLDGGGRGTVVTITADNVVIENLEIINSGGKSTLNTIWGNAGVLVDANHVTLRRLKIVSNDWGIVMRGGKGSLVEASLIEDNVRDGIKVMGGNGHRVRDNVLNHNERGISIDALFGDYRERIIPKTAAEGQQARSMYDNALPSRDITVEENELRGNRHFGIHVGWWTEESSLLRNHIYKTGREPAIDMAALFASMEKLYGKKSANDVIEMFGTGIMFVCWSQKNIVDANDIYDNKAFGIGLDLTFRNRVTKNRVECNKVGISLSHSSNKNQLMRNTVTANIEYGIRIETLSYMARVGGNLITFNDLSENGVNAYDSPGRILPKEELSRALSIPPRKVLKMTDKQYDKYRRQMQSFIEGYREPLNYWDDGKFGNHYDNFDETDEGFVDKNNDGIGEKAYAIPGGTAVDHFPLNADRVRKDLGTKP